MIDIPVHLIQALHERHQCLQGELNTIATLRSHEVLLQAELDRVEALLETYPVLAQDAGADEAVLPDGQSSPAPTLQDCLDALLSTHGPSRATYLQRQLRKTYGLEVATGSLSDLLTYGLKDGRYALTKQVWRLASMPTKEQT